MVSYFLRSNGIFRIASARAVASEIGSPFGLKDLSSLPPFFAGGAAAPAKRSPDGVG